MNTSLAKLSLTLGTFACLIGCVGVSRVHGPPFNEVIGRTLTTRRPAFLAPQKFADSTGEALVSAGHEVLFLFDSSGLHSSQEVKAKVADIPTGQPIKVLEVLEDVGDGYMTYIAVGEVFVPAKKQFVRFYYSWGFNRDLYRAPWESDEVPRVRKR